MVHVHSNYDGMRGRVGGRRGRVGGRRVDGKRGEGRWEE